MPIEFIIIIILIFFSALFSGLETAILGLSSLNIVRGDQVKLKKLFEKKNKLLITFLIANNLTIVGATLTLDLFLTHYSFNGMMTAIIFVSYIIIFFIFAEVLPKAIFRRIDLWVLKYFYYLILFFYYIFFLFTIFFLFLTNILIKILPKNKANDSKKKKEDIFYFLGSHIVEEKDPITSSLMTLRVTKAREIMTPLADIYSLDKNTRIKDCFQVLEDTLYTRYPVYEKRGDNIIGYTEVYDFFENPPSKKISQIIHPATFIPEFLTADDILYKTQKEKTSILFVVNEYGSVIGMVTLEDIAEVIVGEIISEEQEKEKVKIEKINENKYLIDANLDVDEFNKYFSITIEKEEFETINGFILKKAGRIPHKNETFEEKNMKFIVKEANAKEIHKLLLEIM